MKLTSLNPWFIRHECRIEPGRRLKPGTNPLSHTEADVEDYVGPHDYLCHVHTLAEAQGIWFDCPLCTVKNGGPVGTHGVRCFFPNRGVPEDLGLNQNGQPVRWAVEGTDFSDLTLRPSILLTGGGCGWHGFVTAGEVTSV